MRHAIVLAGCVALILGAFFYLVLDTFRKLQDVRSLQRDIHKLNMERWDRIDEQYRLINQLRNGERSPPLVDDTM